MHEYIIIHLVYVWMTEFYKPWLFFIVTLFSLSRLRIASGNKILGQIGTIYHNLFGPWWLGRFFPLHSGQNLAEPQSGWMYELSNKLAAVDLTSGHCWLFDTWHSIAVPAKCVPNLLKSTVSRLPKPIAFFQKLSSLHSQVKDLNLWNELIQTRALRFRTPSE